MKKLCYILPEYDESNISHFYHLYEFLKELSKRLDIFLIIERSKTKNISLGNRVYIQRFHFLPFRFLESFLLILKARILGYKNFYTHYCYIGAINAGIISHLTGGRSFYWNCAMNWLFKQKILSGLGLRASLKLSNFLVTGAETMKKGYASHYGLKPDRIKIMPNRINLERFKKSKPSQAYQESPGRTPTARQVGIKKKTILFVHWLSKRKGAHLLIPIARQLVQNSQFSRLRRGSGGQAISNFQLLIIGDGPYKKKLQEEIREGNLGKFIQVLGGVPNRDIVEYYKKADLFILPSLEEGFPMSLLEPMAMGVPYVASDVGAVREISPSVAQDFIIGSGNVEEFVQKIKILLSDKEIYERFRKEELEKVREYSLAKVVGQFIKLFG